MIDLTLIPQDYPSEELTRLRAELGEIQKEIIAATDRLKEKVDADDFPGKRATRLDIKRWQSKAETVKGLIRAQPTPELSAARVYAELVNWLIGLRQDSVAQVAKFRLTAADLKVRNVITWYGYAAVQGERQLELLSEIFDALIAEPEPTTLRLFQTLEDFTEQMSNKVTEQAARPSFDSDPFRYAASIMVTSGDATLARRITDQVASIRRFYGSRPVRGDEADYVLVCEEMYRPDCSGNDQN
jgi:hypothetical protein